MKIIRYCALTTIAGSLKNFVLPSAINLAKNGYDVTVGCETDDKLREELPDEIRYIPLSISRGYSLSKSVVTIAELVKFFKREKIQMVEYGTETISFCAAIAAWMTHVPVRIYNHWGARYIGFTGVMRAFSLFIERTIALFSTDIRQQSPKNMQMCIEDKVYPARKVKVLGFGGTVGADFSKFDFSKKEQFNIAFRKRYNIPSTDFVFGDIGYIRKDKGHNELLTAFKNINNRNVWLVLVGDLFAPDAPEQALLEWAKKSDRVVFTGRVNDVEHYVASFDCIVHPSYREGLGMVLQEAGAMGVPYIACDIPGPGEIGINDVTGLLVEKGNAEDLQQKMQSLIDNPKKVESMSNAMYDLTKERYERSVMLKRILDDRQELSQRILYNAAQK